MIFSKIYPVYPIRIISPKKYNLRISPRKIFVDFPAEYYIFMFDTVNKIVSSQNPSQIQKTQIRQIISTALRNSNLPKFNGTLLGTFSPTTIPWSSKLLLKLKIRWSIFFKYLENKAQQLISEIQNNGSNIREVYNEILNNYFTIVDLIPAFERSSAYQLEKFKKLVRITRDEEYIKRILSTLKQFMRHEAIKSKGMKFWFFQFESNFWAIEKCFDNMDILSCYFYLRNALENLIKLIVYNDIAKSFNNYYDELLLIFFFYDKIAMKRSGSIKELQAKYIKVIQKFLQSNKNIKPEEIYSEILKKQSPKLIIKTPTIEEFEKSYRISIKNYWSACSEIIHNQSPLPFFSLLEIKAFKYFLEQYSKQFISVIKILKDHTNITDITEDFIHQEPVQCLSSQKSKLSKKAKKILDKLISKKEILSILKAIIKDKELRKNNFFDPLTLVSLFHLANPSLTHIRSGEFRYEDIEYLIIKIQPLLFSINKDGLNYTFDKTLQIFEERIKTKVTKICPEFSSLSNEEKRTIIFYLLVIRLPDLYRLKPEYPTYN